MDFQGQKLAENLLVKITIVFAVIGFIAGYAISDFSLMVKINGVGLALTLLAVLPPWPWYSKNPLPWLPALNPDTDQKTK